MKTLIIGLLSIGLLPAVSVAGMLIVRRLAPKEAFDRHLNLATPLIGVVGTLFSVMLGFLVAGTVNNYQQAQQKVEQEAICLGNVFRVARGLPAGMRKRIRDTCRVYTSAVVQLEWPLMEERKTSSKAWQLYYDLWDESLSFEPAGQRESNIHAALLQAVQSLGECRRSRVVYMNNTISAALWLVVASGSLIIILFTYAFVAEGALIQSLMTGLVSLSLGLNIFLLMVYSDPFVGGLKIKPEGFLVNMDLFRQPDVPPRYLRFNL